MATYRHWSVSLWRDPDDVPHCQMMFPWQNWTSAYLGYTLRMKMLFRGRPVMVYDMHTRCSWLKMKSWWGKDTDQNISVRSLIFAVGWTLCGQPQPEHESMLLLLSFFSVKCFNQLKLYHLSVNILRKPFASYFLFTDKHLIKYWSSVLNLIAVTAVLLTAWLYHC